MKPSRIPAQIYRNRIQAKQSKTTHSLRTSSMTVERLKTTQKKRAASITKLHCLLVTWAEGYSL